MKMFNKLINLLNQFVLRNAFTFTFASKNKKKESKEPVIETKYSKFSDKDLMKRGGRGGGRMVLFHEKPKNTKQTIKRLVKYLAFNKKYLFILLFVVSLSSIASIASPTIQGKAIDAIILRDDMVLSLNDEGYLVVNNQSTTIKALVNGNKDDIIFNYTTIKITDDLYYQLNDEKTPFLAYNKDDTKNHYQLTINKYGYVVYKDEVTNYQFYQSTNNSKLIELTIKGDPNQKWVINDIKQSIYAFGVKDPNLLINLLGLLLGIYIFSSILTFVSSISSAYLSLNTVKKMRKDLFTKIVYLPIKYFDTHQHGDMMSRMTNDVDSIANTVSQSISSLISAVLTIIGALCVMLYYSWLLTMFCFITLGLTLVMSKIMTKYMRKYYRAQQSLIGELNAQVEEMVIGHKTVAAYSKEQDVEDEFNQISHNLRRYGFRANLWGGAMGPIMNIINNISYLLIVSFGAFFVSKGINGLTLGLIITFTSLSKQFSRPINTIASLYAQIQSSIASAERVFAIMDEDNEIDNGELMIDEAKDISSIVFKDVNFAYVKDEPVLKNFNLTVEPGQKIALVGATGSGKTTVVNLLMRFYDIDSGKITIGGIDITEISKKSLRNQIAIVLQDTVLFKDTVKNNILYGRENATDEEIISSAIMSNSDGFITLLPQQYESMLSEGGSNLSGGQRQLLSIARAILADPKILILDEATSSVDTRTEKNIQDGMITLMKNRTSLIIAHRLSTIRDADKIVVMDHGEVVEIGRHDELLEKKGRYYQLYQIQFAGNQI